MLNATNAPQIASGLLFAFGLLFPVMSVTTLILALAQERRTGRRPSWIAIPVIGPAFMSFATLSANWPDWLIPIWWISDLGTIQFALFTPRLVRMWWETSRFTQIRMFESRLDNRRTRLTLHRNGRYRLQIYWRRPKGEVGMIQINELGRFEADGNAIYLRPTKQRECVLTKVSAGEWIATENALAESERLLHGIRFTDH